MDKEEGRKEARVPGTRRARASPGEPRGIRRASITSTDVGLCQPVKRLTVAWRNCRRIFLPSVSRFSTITRRQPRGERPNKTFAFSHSRAHFFFFFFFSLLLSRFPRPARARGIVRPLSMMLLNDNAPARARPDTGGHWSVAQQRLRAHTRTHISRSSQVNRKSRDVTRLAKSFACSLLLLLRLVCCSPRGRLRALSRPESRRMSHLTVFERETEQIFSLEAHRARLPSSSRPCEFARTQEGESARARARELPASGATYLYNNNNNFKLLPAFLAERTSSSSS